MNLKTLFPFFLLITLAICVCITVMDTPKPISNETKKDEATLVSDVWIAPDTTTFPIGDEGNLIRYGQKLIQHTSYYFGPKGKLKHTTNGMNCQNCHLQSGTKPWGNNYAAVAANYPKLRARSGKVETIFNRINDCFERSLNGKKLDTNSNEMKAMSSYILWLGRNIEKGLTPKGTGLMKLTFLDRKTDPLIGKKFYVKHCQSCHQSNGGGLLNADSTEFVYPPLWGNNSYNIGAGMHCISKLAGFIKPNMPFGTTHLSMVLTDEEAWDIAAYVNSQKRPTMNLSKDWPDISKKPIDYPFGPYADQLTELQHKFGPYVDATLAKNK